MPSMLRCCLRVCFDDREEDSEDSHSAPRSNRMIRIFQAAEEDEAGDEDCCQTNEDSEGTVATATTVTPAAPSRRMSGSSNNAPSLRQFWRTFREKLNLGTTESNASTDPEVQQQKRDETIPILTQASSFDSSKDIPTILSEHVVLPGSELQAQMAMAMAAKLEAHDHDDECVICMDGFDPTNPRMPTLCGCGENKTYFHLPCLYQWIEQSRNCPSCAKRLRWEEF